MKLFFNIHSHFKVNLNFIILVFNLILIKKKRKLKFFFNTFISLALVNFLQLVINFLQ